MVIERFIQIIRSKKFDTLIGKLGGALHEFDGFKVFFFSKNRWRKKKVGPQKNLETIFQMLERARMVVGAAEVLLFSIFKFFYDLG